MNTGWTVALIALGAIAAAYAIFVGSNASLAGPAAAAAVAAAALLLYGVFERTRWPSVAELPGVGADPAGVRQLFADGSRGRKELITLLDQLERGDRPSARGGRSLEEIAEFQAMNDDEFHAYLVGRVGELEARA